MTKNQKIVGALLVVGALTAAIVVRSGSHPSAPIQAFGDIQADVPANNAGADLTQYAILNANSTVAQVVVCTDSEIIKFALGKDQTYVKECDAAGARTTQSRASRGFVWDGIGFIPPKPVQPKENLVCDSWILNKNTYRWEPPIPPPTQKPLDDSKENYWSEVQKAWTELPIKAAP